MLKPNKHGEPWSGSVIVDHGDVSHFHRNPHGDDTFLAYATRQPNSTLEIWYSNDKGTSYRQYEKDGLVKSKNGQLLFPSVRKFQNKFLMAAVSVENNEQVEFYESRDLKEWKYLSSFGQFDGAHGSPWESPDLIPFEIGDKIVCVLVVSITQIGPNVGGGVQYFVGHFDGKKFYNRNGPGTILWLDQGPDFYAALTFESSDPGGWAAMAWADNLAYYTLSPTKPWRGINALPRILELTGTHNGYRILNRPVGFVNELKGEELIYSGNQLALRKFQNKFKSSNFHIRAKVHLLDTITFTLSSKINELIIMITPHGDIYIDRSKSGKILSDAFAQLITGQREVDSKDLDVSIYFDEIIMELFLDYGASSFTVLVFPETPYDTLSVKSSKSKMLHLAIYDMKSVWKND